MDTTLQHGTNDKSVRGSDRIRGQNLRGANSSKSEAKNSKQELTYLDLFSTSQTNKSKRKDKNSKSGKEIYDACANNAPYFGYQIEGKKWGIVQGCCNNWNCPRCGKQRAKEEYARIVIGCREVGKKYPLYMLTITCRGKEITYEDAENGYLVWTNKLLTRLRMSHKRSGKEWYYASVTERQKRQHPHSHFLTTYSPPDAVLVKKGEGKYSFTDGCYYVARHNTLQSETLERACVDCGLGWQYDISELESVEGASRYVAKYLFKETVFTTIWPKGWRRVRYSQSWPKLEDIKTDAMILLSNEDWNNLARKALIVTTFDNDAKQIATRRLSYAGVIVQ